MDDLYYVENIGCDDSTRGIVNISEEDLPKFKQFLEDLNKNSTYGCMPKIELYKIDMSFLRESNEKDNTEDCLFLGDKSYVLRERWCYDGMERVV
jgi:hypothetical protein